MSREKRTRQGRGDGGGSEKLHGRVFLALNFFQNFGLVGLLGGALAEEVRVDAKLRSEA
eukprot:CAMPEP_0197561730 /NCGR_PEP_ID=MMETSP1320-20131121/25738_1 /TAXON_ID=91990 /ORGANISM="Bolidomonas sp., Strain RCC2347" /LENGTH=58 /DNA_ID=CAMNT_0043123407 /DNA_START=31 /DNA_END=203 /DNA_ORIENTATION=-